MIFILLIIVACLIGLAALMSAAETAIIATTPGKIEKLRADGKANVRSLVDILKTKEQVISTLLIGNSIATTLSTTIATGVFIELLGDDIGTIISSIAMSFIIIVFAEVTPKAIAVVKAETIASHAAPILTILLKILNPVNSLISHIIKAFCFIFRINLNQEISGTEEVRNIIEHHLHEGNVYKDDRDMLGGILDIRQLLISDIMVHRSNIFTINIKLPPAKLIKIALASSHTRIPIWENNQDNIIGILYVKDLLSKTYTSKNNLTTADIQSLLKPPLFVPDNALVIKQLQNFRKGQSHLACVVDEYGEFQGIVTLEDILEEIVGQIDDEYDQRQQQLITKISSDEYIIDATISVRDLNRELDWKIPETAATIAGFILHQLERIPDQGEFVIFNNIKLVVMEKSTNRINKIKAVILAEDKQHNEE